MEQKHSMVNCWLGGKRKKHAVTVSLANRMLEFERRLQARPALLHEIAAHLDSVRTCRGVCEQFRFMQHPSIQALLQRDPPAHHSYYSRPATDLFYHCA